jgi:hypothetical protein
MPRYRPPAPLELAKAFAVPQYEVAALLDMTVGWMRVRARDPRFAHRVRIAELEAILDRERERYTLESMLAPGNGGQR